MNPRSQLQELTDEIKQVVNNLPADEVDRVIEIANRVHSGIEYSNGWRDVFWAAMQVTYPGATLISPP